MQPILSPINGRDMLWLLVVAVFVVIVSLQRESATKAVSMDPVLHLPAQIPTDAVPQDLPGIDLGNEAPHPPRTTALQSYRQNLHGVGEIMVDAAWVDGPKVVHLERHYMAEIERALVKGGLKVVSRTDAIILVNLSRKPMQYDRIRLRAGFEFYRKSGDPGKDLWYDCKTLDADSDYRPEDLKELLSDGVESFLQAWHDAR